MRGLIPVLVAALSGCLIGWLGAAPPASASARQDAAPPAVHHAAPGARGVPDTLAQRLAPCLSCHGNAAAPTTAASQGDRAYFPRIAGKPAGYLFNQLENFRAGRRQYPLMTWMVTPLSDAYLHEIADYFAAEHLPAPVLDRASLPAAQLERGRLLVTRGDALLRVPACIACHGARLTGALPTVPGLVGLPRDYINAQFGAWRNGTRRARAPDCMATIAARLSLTDVAAISAWLASEPLPPDPTPAPALTRPLPLGCGSVPEGA